jgi:membrane protease YdiL (CAAX protease family)
MSEALDNPADAPAAPAAPPAPSRLARFWRHPITQLLARIIFFIVVASAVGYLLRMAIDLPKYEGEGGMAATLTESGATPWLRQLRNLLPTIVGYYLMVRLLERRKLGEFAPRKAPLHSLTGWLTGMGILLAAAAVLALPGYYAVHGTHPDAQLLSPLLVLGIGAGVGEEIVARGILFRVVEECFGTWFALLFSAALFGLGHIANPNSNVWMALAIAVEAGLLLGMAFAWTRSMWFVIALHAAWNFTQGPLLGIPVSGIAVTGLLDSTLKGPPVLSGGQFGAEGSLLTVLICLVLAAFFTKRAIAAGRIVPPYWKRRLPDGSVAVPRFEASAPKP